MNKDTKKQILDLIEKLDTELDDAKTKLFWDDSGSKQQKNEKVGCNQFRSLAENCRAADCYEEIKLLVEYKTAKASKGNSWQFPCGKDKKAFGIIITEYMEKVKKLDDAEIMENLQYFFGYLYWKARIWAAAAQPQENNRDHGNHQNNNGNNHSNGYGNRGNQQNY